MAANSGRDAMLHQMALPYHHTHHHHHHHHAHHHTDFMAPGDTYHHLNSSPSSSSMSVDHTHHHHALGTGDNYRQPSSAPLRKLTVDLIKTYRKINDVSEIGWMGYMWEKRECMREGRRESREREKGGLYMCMHVCVCVRDREHYCTCVFVCEWTAVKGGGCGAISYRSILHVSHYALAQPIYLA
jgi:hypothetical protein